MGKRGPKPVPEAVKRFRSDRIGCPSLSFGTLSPVAASVPKPPSWLRTHGQSAWKNAAKILTELGLLTPIDHDALAQYCSAWDDFYDAESHIREHGIIATGHAGNDITSPAVRIKSDAAARIAKFGAMFGMSPTGRSGLPIVTPDAPIDDLEAFKRS